MLAGNQRFVHDEDSEIVRDAKLRRTLSAGQHPFAQVFGCADSRVAAELVFDQGLGELFVVRTAGHVVDSGVLGSLEFGVTVLNIPLIVVLGHDSCGAVRAALDAYSSGTTPGGYLRDIVTKVMPSTLKISVTQDHHPSAEDVLSEHVKETVQLLVERSATIGDAVKAGRLGIVGATYKLAEGSVVVEHSIGPVEA